MSVPFIPAIWSIVNLTELKRMSLPRIYLAAAYDRREEINRIARELSESGFRVVSTWHEPGNDDMPLSAQAERDLSEIEECRYLVHFTGGGKGGRIFEAGYALGYGKDLLIVGLRETVFDHMRGDVRQFWTLDDFWGWAADFAAQEHASGED